MNTGRFLVGDLLQIIGHDYTSHGPLGLGDPDGAIHQLTDLRGDRGHMNVISRDILKKGDEIDLLLIIAAHCHSSLLTDDRDDALMIHFGIV